MRSWNSPAFAVALFAVAGLAPVFAQNSGGALAAPEKQIDRPDLQAKPIDGFVLPVVAESDPEIDPEAAKIVHTLVAFYSQAQSLSATISVREQWKSDALKKDVTSEQSFAYAQPNRFTLAIKGENGHTCGVACDGKKLTVSGASGAPVESAAPESLSRAVGVPDAMENGLFEFGVLASFFEKDPYGATMAGVIRAKYLGIEKVGANECDHLAFTQDEADWEIWVDRGEKPLLRKQTLDLAKAVTGHLPIRQAKAPEGVTALITLLFGDWTFNQPLPEPALEKDAAPGTPKVFTVALKDEKSAPAPAPAPAAEAPAPPEADSDEEPSPLVGQSAPAITSDLLTGGNLDLSAHKDKEIVVLDFWATWCGPCVAALPILTEVTAAYREKGVRFYAVDQGEDAATIKAFLKAKKLDITVALDPDGKAGKAYGVEGIPQTVIIDKTGKIQVVHVGFSPGLKQEFTGYLDALLAGKSLIRKKAMSIPSVKGFEPAWQLAGKFGGLAAADGGKLYALGAHGHISLVDAAGAAGSELALESSGALLRAGHLAGHAADAPRDLICFAPWGAEVQAFDAKGALLWTYGGGEGVDDVAVADLKGDGQDEVIVGYNGGTGLHVLTSKGKPLWKADKLSNVWHVAAGDLTGSGAPTIVATAADGDVHIFSADGTKQTAVKADLFANMVRILPGAKGQPGKIVIAGSGDDREVIAALDPDGKKLWDLTASDGKGHIDAAVAAPGQPWLAVSMRGGRVLVVDTDKGAIIAEASGEAPRGELAWIGEEGAPLLVVTGRDALHAYRIAPH